MSDTMSSSDWHRAFEVVTNERDELQGAFEAQKVAMKALNEFHKKEIATLKKALEYMADESNWYDDDGSYRMKRPGGSQKSGIFLTSHTLLPWVFATEALGGG